MAPRVLISDALSPAEAEENAARIFVKRRKMGPFRKTPGDAAAQRKELASLARAGFSLDIACRVLNTTLPEDEE